MFTSSKRRIRLGRILGNEASQGLRHQSLHWQHTRAINRRDTERSHSPARGGHAMVERDFGHHDDLEI